MPDKPTIVIFKTSSPSKFERERVEREAFRATEGNTIGVSATPWSRRFVQVRCDLVRSRWFPSVPQRISIPGFPGYDFGDCEQFFRYLVPFDRDVEFVKVFQRALLPTLRSGDLMRRPEYFKDC
jgi:hypothetical protein